MQNDFYHFEGNTQALRVVSKLHFLVDENGMNLTKALLGTIIKYPVSSVEINKKSGDIRTKKMGYFYADRRIFDNLQFSLGTDGKRHPLTFLLEAADDIAYKTADIEDALKKGCISYRLLLEELKSRMNPSDENNDYGRMIDILEKKYEKALKNNYEQPDVYAVQNWVVSIQGNMLFAASDQFIEHYDEIMEGTFKKDLFYGTGVEKMMKALGDIAYEYAFISKPIFKLEIAAKSILDFLLDKFVDAVLYYDTEAKLSDIRTKWMTLISEDYKRIYHHFSKGCPEDEKLYLRLLLVTDYVCGMTDSFAKNLYQELKGIV